jgi:hypothetical protein
MVISMMWAYIFIIVIIFSLLVVFAPYLFIKSFEFNLHKVYKDTDHLFLDLVVAELLKDALAKDIKLLDQLDTRRPIFQMRN